MLRISEPGGIPLRDNDPAAARWYLRDVVAIAQALLLTAMTLRVIWLGRGSRGRDV